MSGVINNDPYESCPYNPSHIIRRSRMQSHLVKCSENYPDVEFDTCPYNATHRVPKPEMRFHLEKCPDQRIIEEQKYQTEDEVTYGGVTEYVKPKLPGNGENWDESAFLTYEPSSSVSNAVLLRNMRGGTKSQRKQFRSEQRKRIANLSNESTEPELSTEKVDTQLRLPRAPSKAVLSIPPGSKLGMGRGVLSFPDTNNVEFSVGANSSTNFGGFGRGRGLLLKDL